MKANRRLTLLEQEFEKFRQRDWDAEAKARTESCLGRLHKRVEELSGALDEANQTILALRTARMEFIKSEKEFLKFKKEKP